MTGRPDSFLPLFVADYLADTSHLARDQHGAYLLLLMAYWRKGGPLPADDARLANTAKATPAEWKRLRPVMLEFFSEVDGYWVNKRSDEEITNAVARTNAKAEAGKRGAAKRWQKDGGAIAVPLANGMTKNSSSPPHKPPNGGLGRARERAEPPQNQAPKRALWPENGVVPEAWITMAEGERKRLGLPPVDIRVVAAKFANLRSAQTNQPRTQTEWQADWKNFVLKEHGGANGSGQSGRGSAGATLDAIANEVAELEGVHRG